MIKRIWLLSGIGEGPIIAEKFIGLGFCVSVSVVSDNAALAYEDIELENLWIGEVGGQKQISQLIKKHKKIGKSFDFVVDGTHPFAEQISEYLRKACKELEQPLVRYVRPYEKKYSCVKYLPNIDFLRSYDLKNENILIALGSKKLVKTVEILVETGATLYARLLPTRESYLNALKSGFPESNFALIKPSKDKFSGYIEEALCEKWEITSIICKQSGGFTEKLWTKIAIKKKIKLYLISRPIYDDYCPTFTDVNQIEVLFSEPTKKNYEF